MYLKAVYVRERNPAFPRGTPFTTPYDIYQRWKDMADEPEEVFRVMYLDARHRYLCHRDVSRGTLTGSMVHPREIFKYALIANAQAIVLIHNHPSGDPTPSLDDIAVTRRLADVGDLLGVRVLDHIIIGHDGFHSLRQDGQM